MFKSINSTICSIVTLSAVSLQSQILNVFKLTALLILFSTQLLHSQCVNNPSIQQGNITPAPLVCNTGTAQFTYFENLLDYSGWQTDPVVITVCLLNITPQNGASSVGGNFHQTFNWLYDPTSNCLQGTQNQTILGGTGGLITIDFEILTPIACPNNQMGFNANIQPAACMNGINETVDDTESVYTCYDGPGNPTATYSVSNLTCNNGNDGTITLTVPGGANYSYTWSNGAATKNVLNLSAGTYSVTITDNNAGCTTVLSGIQVTEPPVLNLSINLQNSSCGNSTGQLEAQPNGGVSPYQYLWNTGAMTASINNLSCGTYTVTVTDFVGCERVESISLTSSSCPDVSNITSTVLSPTEATVSWTAPVNPVVSPEGYHVFYRKIGDPTYKAATQYRDPWINEIRYKGLISSRGFEIIGPDELDLLCYKVQLFRVNGNRLAGNSGIRNLSGIFNQNASTNFFEAIWDQENFDAGGGYIALYYDGNTCDCPNDDKLVEFLSFGSPTSPPDTAAVTVHPVLDNAVIQSTLSISNTSNSIGLTGSVPGDTPNDFTWQELTYTPNALNPNQVVYSKLFGSNDQITIENLEPCTTYQFHVRTDCGVSVGSLLSSVAVTTENSINNANFKDQNGVFINEMNICEGTNPNFMGDAAFTHKSPTNTCPIEITYFITNLNGVIIDTVHTIPNLNNYISTLPNNPYLIQAIGHFDSIMIVGTGNTINDVGSNGCFKLTSTPIELKVYNIPTVTTTVVKPSVCGASDGSITISVGNVNPALGGISYKIQPDPWSTNPVIGNLSAGSYTILVSIHGCYWEYHSEYLLRHNLSGCSRSQWACSG